MRTIILISLFFISAAANGSGKHKMDDMNGDCSNYKIDLKKEFSLIGKKAQKKESLNKVTAKNIFKDIGDKRINLSLHEKAKLAFLVSPEQIFHPEAKTHGGILSFKVKEDGIYRVSGNGKFWFDIVDFNKKSAVKAKGYKMQKQCESIFKVVSFDLKKESSYLLQVSSSKSKNVDLLLTKVK